MTDERQVKNLGGKRIISFTFITFLIGIMLAIQFQTVQDPVVRDTRDTWQLRADLEKGKELEAKLIREISSTEEKLSNYLNEREQSKEETLRNTLEELKEEAGLTDVTGPGVKIYIDKVNDQLVGYPFEENISPDLLSRLLNEINMYGAEHVSIGGQRVINSTVIREIAGSTKINGRTIKEWPIEILVVTKDMKTAEKLCHRLRASSIVDNFFIDNMTLTVMDAESDVTIPAYEDEIRLKNIQAAE